MIEPKPPDELEWECSSKDERRRPFVFRRDANIVVAGYEDLPETLE